MFQKYYRYDDNGNAIFLKNAKGDELYATSRSGSQVYPKKGTVFAKNRFGLEYYAKRANGDEKLPIRKHKPIGLYRMDTPIMPLKASGEEKYPSCQGDEYYLKYSSGHLLILKDKDGNDTFARKKDGRLIIPIEHFNDKVNRPYKLSTDFAGNPAYIVGHKEECIPPEACLGICNACGILGSILTCLT